MVKDTRMKHHSVKVLNTSSQFIQISNHSPWDNYKYNYEKRQLNLTVDHYNADST